MQTSKKWNKLDAELQSEQGLRSWAEYLTSESIPFPDRLIALKQLRQRLCEPGADMVRSAIEKLFVMTEVG